MTTLFDSKRLHDRRFMLGRNVINMGKTRRHHGRENGHRAKCHRWWRKNEGFCTRKDTDRFKVAQAASAAVRHEGISLKTRNTTVPRMMETKGYGFTPHPFPLEH